MAYVEGQHFWDDRVEIRLPDSQKTVAATLSRQKISTQWTWKIDVHLPGIPATHPIVLSTIAAKRSFSELVTKITTDDDGNLKTKRVDDTDVCNELWFASMIICFIVLFLVCCGTGYFFWEGIQKGVKKYQQWIENNSLDPNTLEENDFETQL